MKAVLCFASSALFVVSCATTPPAADTATPPGVAKDTQQPRLQFPSEASLAGKPSQQDVQKSFLRDFDQMQHRLATYAEQNQSKAESPAVDDRGSQPTAKQHSDVSPSAVAAAARPMPPIKPVATRTAVTPDPDAVASPAISTPAPQRPRAAPANSDAKLVADMLSQAIAARLTSQTPAGGQPENRPLTKALAEAAMAVGDPDQPFDVSLFKGLDEEEKTFVTRFHAACTVVGRDLASGRPLSEISVSIGKSLASIESSKPLRVTRADLATKVEGFGRITSIENRRFLPGRSTQVILYSEIEGFVSERQESTTTARAAWVTNLATKISIITKDGTEVWSRDWQAVSDASEVRRNEFFICDKVTLTDFLTVGSYIMKSTIRDEKTGAIAEKSIDFALVADPSLVSR